MIYRFTFHCNIACCVSAFLYLHNANCCYLHSLWDVGKAIWNRTKGVWCCSNKYCCMLGRICCAIRNEQSLQVFHCKNIQNEHSPNTTNDTFKVKKKKKLMMEWMEWWIAICPVVFEFSESTSVSLRGLRASLALGWEAELATSAQHLLRAQLEAISRAWKGHSWISRLSAKINDAWQSVYARVCVRFR